MTTKQLFTLDFAARFGNWFLEFYYDHAAWSQETFGDDTVRGPQGPLKHMIKEVNECLKDPKNIEEYADLLLLWVDATRRAGFSPIAMIQAARAKLNRCKEREWPKPSADEPVEHVRTPKPLEAQPEMTLGAAVERDELFTILAQALGIPKETFDNAAKVANTSPEEQKALDSRDAWSHALGVDVNTGKPLQRPPQPKAPEEEVSWLTPHPKDKDASSSPVGMWNLVADLQAWVGETLPNDEAEELQVSWLTTVKDDSIMMGNLHIWSHDDGFTMLDEDARTEERFDRFRTLNLDNCIKEFRAQLIVSRTRIRVLMDATIKKA